MLISPEQSLKGDLQKEPLGAFCLTVLPNIN